MTEDVNEREVNAEERKARGIAAMGRVERDADGFTVYETGPAPDAFRVWDDPHAGTRCTCDRFDSAFRAGEEYACEHVLAVALALDPPDDEVPRRTAPAVEPVAETDDVRVRRVV